MKCRNARSDRGSSPLFSVGVNREPGETEGGDLGIYGISFAGLWDWMALNIVEKKGDGKKGGGGGFEICRVKFSIN